MPLPNDIIVALLGLFAVVVPAVITGWVTYRLGMRKVRSEDQSAEAKTQNAVNESFSLLVKTFQEEREQTRKDMQEIRDELQMINLHVTSLERELIKNGHIVPPRPVRPRAAAA